MPKPSPRSPGVTDAAAILRTFTQRATFRARFRPVGRTPGKGAARAASTPFARTLEPLVSAATDVLVCAPTSLAKAPARGTTAAQRADWLERYLERAGRRRRVRLDTPGVRADSEFWWWLFGAGAGALVVVDRAEETRLLATSLHDPFIWSLTRLGWFGRNVTPTVLRAALAEAIPDDRIVLCPHVDRAGAPAEVDVFATPERAFALFWRASGLGEPPAPHALPSAEPAVVFARVLEQGGDAALAACAVAPPHTRDQLVCRTLEWGTRAGASARDACAAFGAGELVAAREGHPSKYLDKAHRAHARKGRAFATPTVVQALQAIRDLGGAKTGAREVLADGGGDQILGDLLDNLQARLGAVARTRELEARARG